MSVAAMVGAGGGIAMVAAAAWWGARWVRRWWTTVRLRWIQAYHGSLRAELQMSYERIYTRCADRPVWTEQKLADMQWAFTEIDGVLEKRRLDEVAVLGRIVPAVAPPVVPIVLGTSGAVAVVFAVIIGL